MGATRRTIWTYYAYRATQSYGFYLPVSEVLLVHRGYGLDVLGLTQTAFLFASVLAEIPAGYVADRLGRRASLAVGNGIVCLVMGLYAFAGSAAGYVALFACWGIGWAFHSAIGDAWLYDLLSGAGDEAAFARTSGRGETVELAISAGAAIVASVLYVADPALPFLANAALAAAGIPLLVALPATRMADHEVLSVRDAVAVLRAQVRRPEIGWLVAYAALFNVLFSATRWLEQPALEAVGFPVVWFGALYAAFKLVSAGATYATGWLQDSVGPRRLFALYVPLCGLAYGLVALVPVAVVPVLFLRRGLDRISTPVRNQYINDRLDGAGRATVLSGVSMALHLASGASNAFVGRAAEAVGPVRILAATGVVVAVTAGVLWLSTSPIRPASTATPPAAGEREAAGSD